MTSISLVAGIFDITSITKVLIKDHITFQLTNVLSDQLVNMGSINLPNRLYRVCSVHECSQQQTQIGRRCNLSCTKGTIDHAGRPFDR